jgi:hypothetical protein
MGWYFIQLLTLCPITIFDKNDHILDRAARGPRIPRPMLTGEIRSQIDAVWNAFWTGGISTRSR